jgi:hypothetical protein
MLVLLLLSLMLLLLLLCCCVVTGYQTEHLELSQLPLQRSELKQLRHHCSSQLLLLCLLQRSQSQRSSSRGAVCASVAVDNVQALVVEKL